MYVRCGGLSEYPQAVYCSMKEMLTCFREIANASEFFRFCKKVACPGGGEGAVRGGAEGSQTCRKVQHRETKRRNDLRFPSPLLREAPSSSCGAAP